MKRTAVIGNSGGGKSTLARRLAEKLGHPYHEIDALLWEQGWVLRPADIYEPEHERLLAGESWVIDGLGRLESLPARLARATRIILVDMPVWRHFSFAAKRQLEWAAGRLEHKPAGLAEMPDMDALFETIWFVDQQWMPQIRAMVASEGERGKDVLRLTSPEELDRLHADWALN